MGETFNTSEYFVQYNITLTDDQRRQILEEIERNAVELQNGIDQKDPDIVGHIADNLTYINRTNNWYCSNCAYSSTCKGYKEVQGLTSTDLQTAQKGDFIYLDPPYQPINNTSYFTAYTTFGFDDRDQEELANVFSKLADKGCLVLLSNSDTPFIRELYSGYSVKEVDVQRAINCKGSKRVGHKELIISNYS